jgi:hypothetical protein
MSKILIDEAVAKQAREALEFANVNHWWGSSNIEKALADLDTAIAKAEKQEPGAWIPIEQMYPQAKAIDILMGDGSILCAVLPQFDGDLWWEGSGTGEKFIDPKYANVTHWKIHADTTPPAAPVQPAFVALAVDEARMALFDAINKRDEYGLAAASDDKLILQRLRDNGFWIGRLNTPPAAQPAPVRPEQEPVA